MQCPGCCLISGLDDHSRKLVQPQAKMGPASQAVQGNKGNFLHIVTKHKFEKLNKAKPECNWQYSYFLK